MPPQATEWGHTPSSSIEDTQETASDTSDDPFGGPIDYRVSSTNESTSTTAISKEAGSETTKGNKRRRRDREYKETTEQDPQAPQKMIDQWYKTHPDHAPDPAVLRKTFTGTMGRPVKVMDITGHVLKVEFHKLVVYQLGAVEENDHGVWVLEDNRGRKRIVKRRRLGKSLKMLLTETSPGKDQNAEAGFFVWLGEGKFSKDPAGYIITESLDFNSLSQEQIDEVPVLYALTSDSADAKSKKIKPDDEDLPIAIRRSSRNIGGPSTYRVSSNSFPRYADESTESARRASNPATTSPPRGTRSKSRKATPPRRSHKKSNSKVFDNSVSPPSPPPTRATSQKSAAAPANVRFEFLLVVRKSSRFRDVSICNDAEKFFAEVHKSAMIDKKEKPNVAMCKFSWLPKQREQAVLEGDDDDFDDLMKTIENAPAGKDCSVEVAYLSP